MKQIRIKIAVTAHAMTPQPRDAVTVKSMTKVLSSAVTILQMALAIYVIIS
ncbi:MAG: hypothetical protein WBL85_00880 [Sedimentisphaerales bacterium]